ncbi:MAG: hypothetical protein R3B48_15445 [Kofleriaceae bacterium]
MMTRNALALFLASLLFSACAALDTGTGDSAIRGGGHDDPQGNECAIDSDCGAGFECEHGFCKEDDVNDDHGGGGNDDPPGDDNGGGGNDDPPGDDNGGGGNDDPPGDDNGGR